MTSFRFLSILDGAIQEYYAKTFAQRLIRIYLCTMQCIPICSTLTDNKGNVLVEIVGYSSELLAPGTFRGKKCVVPFSLPLKSKGDKNDDSLLLETYHGVRVKIVYNIKAGLKRRSRLQQIQLITGLFSVFSKHASNLK